MKTVFYFLCFQCMQQVTLITTADPSVVVVAVVAVVVPKPQPQPRLGARTVRGHLLAHMPCPPAASAAARPWVVA